MAKYNPRKQDHRKWLAQRVLKIVLAYGYMMQFDTGECVHAAQEMIFYRKVNGFTITVYTSIDKRSREIRSVGSDAIRVIATKDGEELRKNLRFHRIIHRKGSFKSIGDRLAEGLRIANWNCENPEKPRWNGENRGKKKKSSYNSLTKS